MTQNLFPALDKDETLKRVREAWDLSGDFPVPKFTVRCPICGSEEVQARYWSFHDANKHYHHAVPYRCDISFKCTRCSAIWEHGIPIPEAVYRRHIPEPLHYITKTYRWREVKEKLNQVKG